MCPSASEAPTARPFHEWVAETIDAPGASSELSLVALVDDQVVGWAGLAALGSEKGAADTLLTGVVSGARGRGIATALQQEQGPVWLLVHGPLVGDDELYSSCSQPSSRSRRSRRKPPL